MLLTCRAIAYQASGFVDMNTSVQLEYSIIPLVPDGVQTLLHSLH